MPPGPGRRCGQVPRQARAAYGAPSSGRPVVPDVNSTHSVSAMPRPGIRREAGPVQVSCGNGDDRAHTARSAEAAGRRRPLPMTISTLRFRDDRRRSARAPGPAGRAACRAAMPSSASAASTVGQLRACVRDQHRAALPRVNRVGIDREQPAANPSSATRCVASSAIKRFSGAGRQRQRHAASCRSGCGILVQCLMKSPTVAWGSPRSRPAPNGSSPNSSSKLATRIGYGEGVQPGLEQQAHCHASGVERLLLQACDGRHLVHNGRFECIMLTMLRAP